jgi:hypothetical protein
MGVFEQDRVGDCRVLDCGCRLQTMGADCSIDDRAESFNYFVRIECCKMHHHIKEMKARLQGQLYQQRQRKVSYKHELPIGIM